MINTAILISKTGSFEPVSDVFEKHCTVPFKRDFSKTLYGMNADYYLLERLMDREALVSIRKILAESGADLIQTAGLINPKEKSIFVFDMDSTLIKEEVIDELARANGVYENVAYVTREAMEGKLDFDSALRKRCSYLTGLEESVFQKTYERLNLQDGAESLLKELKKKNCILGVYSGGFSPILERFASEFHFDYWSANELEIKDGQITGNVLGEIVNKNRKRDLLLKHRQERSVNPIQSVATGDGSNDVLMLNAAGVGIGFHAKEGLKSGIENWIDFHPLTALLFLFDPHIE